MLPPAVEKEEGGGPPQSCNHRLPRSRGGREGMGNGGEREEGGRRRGTWSPEVLGSGSGSELVRFLARHGRRRAGGRWRRTAGAGGVEGAPWLERSGEGDGAATVTDGRMRRGGRRRSKP